MVVLVGMVDYRLILGGLLSETGMPGMQLVIEGVRQMRGEANLQVKNAKKGIVSNQGEMHTHSTLILSQ